MKKGLTFIVLILALSLCFGFCAVAAGAEEPAAIDNDAMFDIVRETCAISSSFWEDAKISKVEDGKRTYSFNSLYGPFSYVLDAYTGEVLEKNEPDLEAVRAQEGFVDPLESEQIADLVHDLCPIDTVLGENKSMSYHKGVWTYSFDSIFGSFLYQLDAFTGEVLEKDEPDVEAVRAQEGFVEPIASDRVSDIIYDLCPIDVAFGTNRTMSYHDGVWTYSFDSLFGPFLYQLDAFTGEILEKDEPDLEAVRAQEGFVEPLDSAGALDKIFEECPIDRIMAKKISSSLQPDTVWLITFSSDYGDFLYMVDAFTGEILEKEEPDVEALRASGAVQDYLTAEEAMDIVRDVCPIGFGEAQNLKTSWRTNQHWVITFDSDYGPFSYDVDGLTGEIVEKEEPDVEALLASGAVQKRLGPGDAITEVFKVAPIKRIMAMNTNAAQNGDTWIITFGSDFGDFSYTVDARTGKILEKEEPDVEAMRASGTVRERRDPLDIKAELLEQYGLKKEDTENPRQWELTKESWGISFDTKDGSWYFEVDAFTGDVLDKEIPEGK